MKPAPPVISAVRRAVIARAYRPTYLLYPRKAICRSRSPHATRAALSRGERPQRARAGAMQETCASRASDLRPRTVGRAPREPLAEDRDDSGLAVRRLPRRVQVRERRRRSVPAQSRPDSDLRPAGALGLAARR